MQKMIFGIAPDITVEVSADDSKELIKEASFWSCLPSKCPMCGATVVFFHKTPQNKPYYGMRCTGEPRHSTNFG